jgi:RNA polymerase sigma factor (sigma-70 family)
MVVQKVCRIEPVGVVILVNMTAQDHDWLRQFTREQSQDAFTALVNRHLNLVYSAALRQVRSPQLAEEVSQSVFTQLACQAAKLNPDTVLTAWLYQVTRHAATDVVRREARRQAREQIAVQMSDMNDTTAAWAHVEPLLDEAMHSLDDTDRTAILLRYFENKSLREVGEALGASEDAAQKRVSRAVERLREFFSKRKVTVGTSGLAALVSANAIQAAPAGLAGSVAPGALATSTALAASAAVAITKTIAMTTLQKTIIAAVLTGAVATGVYQTHQVSVLRSELQSLQKQEAQRASLSAQVLALQVERDRATNALAALGAENTALKKHPTDVLKLRGEVGRLLRENTEIGSTSALSKITADPELMKSLRVDAKKEMAGAYKGFVERVKLTPEQMDKLTDLLTDHQMEGIGLVTTALRDKLTPEQINQTFAAQEAALREQVQALVGPDGLAQFMDYTRNLFATQTAGQLKGGMTGTDEEKEAKSKQLSQAMQEEIQAAITSAGLPADYQMNPIASFRNIASEQEGERSLKLLDDIYQRVASRGSSFLSPEDLAKFQAHRIADLQDARKNLTMNRLLMAPIAN